ncbi:NUDIX hydrolase [Bacillaceae bacterium S4-13-56]
MLEGEYHIVVSAWIRNSEGMIFVQKRHTQKPHPNLWKCPGGSILERESSFDGIIREAEEEIGINLRGAQGEIVKSFRRDHHRDFYDVWLFKKDFSEHDKKQRWLILNG